MSQVAGKAERAEPDGASSADGLCHSSTAALTPTLFWLEASNAVKGTNQMRGLQRFGGESGCQLLAAIVFEDWPQSQRWRGRAQQHAAERRHCTRDHGEHTLVLRVSLTVRAPVILPFTKMLWNKWDFHVTLMLSDRIFSAGPAGLITAGRFLSAVPILPSLHFPFPSLLSRNADLAVFCFLRTAKEERKIHPQLSRSEKSTSANDGRSRSWPHKHAVLAA